MCKAEVLKTYRGTTQTKRDVWNPETFVPGGLKLGGGKWNVLTYMGEQVDYHIQIKIVGELQGR
jgi:hypothetical protein